jgi:D-psicose/D-tagatose/L-ribulose 3-epimerase
VCLDYLKHCIDHLPWPRIAGALKAADYHRPIVIEAFTPEIREIAKAGVRWRRTRTPGDGRSQELRAVFRS